MSQIANEEISSKISEIERNLNKSQSEKKKIEKEFEMKQSMILEQKNENEKSQ